MNDVAEALAKAFHDDQIPTVPLDNCTPCWHQAKIAVATLEKLGYRRVEEVDLHSEARIRVYGEATDDDDGFIEDFEPETCNWFYREVQD